MEEKHMRRALELARQGEGKTSPNPMVGAVIVKDGRVIGEGYHESFGDLHAERNALKAAVPGEQVRGSELYVTLEPCCHHGKTPPCTEAIIGAGISRVIIGSSDPNPKVSGKGVQALRQAGITVEEGFLKEECDALNPVFFHYISTGLPYVVLKYAMTADGKIAAASGKSKWITGEAARNDVQRLRSKYAGIMAGIGTVLADDPLLTCRLPGGRQPVRIICDSFLRLPPESQICRTAPEVPTLAAALSRTEWEQRAMEAGGDPAEAAREYQRRRDCLESRGVRVLELPPAEKKQIPHSAEKMRQLPSAGKEQAAQNSAVDVRALMEQLGGMGIDSVLVEGGASLNFSMLEAGLVSRVCAYIAPKLLGGADAKSPVGGMGVDGPDEAFLLTAPEVRRFGDDIMLEFGVRQRSNALKNEGEIGK